jgi:hypothetical protein
MGVKRVVRDLIIGKDVYIESRNEYRQVILSGHYAIMAMAVIAYYLLMEFSFGYVESLVVFFV